MLQFYCVALILVVLAKEIVTSGTWIPFTERNQDISWTQRRNDVKCDVCVSMCLCVSLYIFLSVQHTLSLAVLFCSVCLSLVWQRNRCSLSNWLFSSFSVPPLFIYYVLVSLSIFLSVCLYLLFLPLCFSVSSACLHVSFISATLCVSVSLSLLGLSVCLYLCFCHFVSVSLLPACCVSLLLGPSVCLSVCALCYSCHLSFVSSTFLFVARGDLRTT